MLRDVSTKFWHFSWNFIINIRQGGKRIPGRGDVVPGWAVGGWPIWPLGWPKFVALSSCIGWPCTCEEMTNKRRFIQPPFKFSKLGSTSYSYNTCNSFGRRYLPSKVTTSLYKNNRKGKDVLNELTWTRLSGAAARSPPGAFFRLVVGMSWVTPRGSCIIFEWPAVITTVNYKLRLRSMVKVLKNAFASSQQYDSITLQYFWCSVTFVQWSDLTREKT